MWKSKGFHQPFQERKLCVCGKLYPVFVQWYLAWIDRLARKHFFFGSLAFSKSVFNARQITPIACQQSLLCTVLLVSTFRCSTFSHNSIMCMCTLKCSKNIRKSAIEAALSRGASLKKRRNLKLWSATGFPLAFWSTKQHIVTCIVCTHHHTNKNTLDISFFFFAGSGVSLSVLFHFL